jgi:hypothetical protein
VVENLKGDQQPAFAAILDASFPTPGDVRSVLHEAITTKRVRPRELNLCKKDA